MPRTRTTHASAILGPDGVARLARTKVLMVGAGGIGCELLKTTLLAGFGHITLLDLDTIDISNLNRQFLFRKKDVKGSKAIVAAATAAPFNPSAVITPIFGNIKDAAYDVGWFQQFDIVLNALDNLDARRHVNRMCMASGTPLIESGTAGYLGQVQPIVKDLTECFDCVPKPTPKTFPVCTIRSTPSAPVHCVVWAKSYLMGELFGEGEEGGRRDALSEAEKSGEGGADQIRTLRAQARAFEGLRAALRDPSRAPLDVAKDIFRKVYEDDVKALLGMEDMWRTRSRPVPLSWDAVLANEPPHPDDVPFKEDWGQGEGGEGEGEGREVIKDQRALSRAENLVLFAKATVSLALRLRGGEGAGGVQGAGEGGEGGGEKEIVFDKDDEDTLDFVTAAANLRSATAGAEKKTRIGKTRWEVKEMAGNIIPAIATTNAVVAGLIVLQAVRLLKAKDAAGGGVVDMAGMKNIHITPNKPHQPLAPSSLIPPNAHCGVCRDVYVVAQVRDTEKVTLGELIRGVVGDRETTAYESARLLSDPDWDDNLGRSLGDLGVGYGAFISLVDEEGGEGGEDVTVQVGIAKWPAAAPQLRIIPSPLPPLPKRARKEEREKEEPGSPVKVLGGAFRFFLLAPSRFPFFLAGCLWMCLRLFWAMCRCVSCARVALRLRFIPLSSFFLDRCFLDR
ncbi:hypothetical protein CYLTODRAFT_362355 [Cylindrobasidium torrendii FP15055 ss-10]|uniref:THIF-type NAD/FAD binding fold domain-containing protein n=1 Tax=Cylindrobasidium torrendii FP15055 ss-10 TaxID=1314674 RepID=A0A0D7AWZ0_9AGAR|nr:hypothetical protein CYLTODRAFT_362355 [Cylindrobasidium torrendii FP15055 ss-10]